MNGRELVSFFELVTAAVVDINKAHPAATSVEVDNAPDVLAVVGVAFPLILPLVVGLIPRHVLDRLDQIVKTLSFGH